MVVQILLLLISVTVIVNLAITIIIFKVVEQTAKHLQDVVVTIQMWTVMIQPYLSYVKTLQTICINVQGAKGMYVFVNTHV